MAEQTLHLLAPTRQGTGASLLISQLFFLSSFLGRSPTPHSHSANFDSLLKMSHRPTRTKVCRDPVWALQRGHWEAPQRSGKRESSGWEASALPQSPAPQGARGVVVDLVPGFTLEPFPATLFRGLTSCP